MHTDDATQFFALLDDVWTLKGTAAMSGAQKALFFGALAPHSFDEVKAGLMAHIRDPKRGQFLPMPADVIAQIQGMFSEDGRPDPEQAWAVCFRALDEAVTLVWCEEMSEAFGIARPLLLGGDAVGARMAFKETYGRLLATARERRTPPRWSATLGHDTAGRNAVLLPHVQAGRLSSNLLLESAPGLDEVLALAAPAEASEASVEAKARAMSAMAKVKADLLARQEGPSAAQLDRERTQTLKTASAKAVRDAQAISQPCDTGKAKKIGRTTPAANHSNITSEAA